MNQKNDDDEDDAGGGGLALAQARSECASLSGWRWKRTIPIRMIHVNYTRSIFFFLPPESCSLSAGTLSTLPLFVGRLFFYHQLWWISGGIGVDFTGRWRIQLKGWNVIVELTWIENRSFGFFTFEQLWFVINLSFPQVCCCYFFKCCFSIF